MINEQFTDGRYQMGYIVEEKSTDVGDGWLIITFSAIPSPNASIKHQYSFRRVLAGVPCHRLFLQDSLYECGCYYLCAGMDFGVADTVFELIESIRERLCVRKEHVITIGSSKGGTCALYFGLRSNYGHVICMGPQTKIATYLDRKGNRSSIHQRMLDYMIGEEDRAASYKKLDSLLFSMLEKRQNTAIHLLTSENDAQYPIHIIPLLSLLDPEDASNDITIDNSIKSHSGLAIVNPYFVKSKIFEILFHVGASWTEDGVKCTVSESYRQQTDIFLWFEEFPDNKLQIKENTVFPITKSGFYTPVLSAFNNKESLFSYKLPGRLCVEGGKLVDYERAAKSQVSADRNRISVSLGVIEDSLVSYAFELERNHETVSRIGYRSSPNCTFTDLEPGVYDLKYYISVGKLKRSHYIRKIEVEGPEQMDRRPIDLGLIRQSFRHVVGKDSISVTSDQDEHLNFSYAFELKRNNEIIARTGYRPSSSHTFQTLMPGVYDVKIYISDGKQRKSFFIRNIEVLGSASVD